MVITVRVDIFVVTVAFTVDVVVVASTLVEVVVVLVETVLGVAFCALVVVGRVVLCRILATGRIFVVVVDVDVVVGIFELVFVLCVDKLDDPVSRPSVSDDIIVAIVGDAGAKFLAPIFTLVIG